MNNSASIFSDKFRKSLSFIFYKNRFLVTYTVIGFISICLEILVFKGLQKLDLNRLFSHSSGLVAGIFFAYWMNVRFNFKIPPTKRKRAFYYFVLISLVSVSINFIFKKQLIELGWSFEKARLTVSGSLFLLGYFFHKKFSFSDYKKVGVAVYANGVENIKGIYEKIGSYPDFIHVDIIDSSFGDIETDPAAYRLEAIRAYWPETPIHIHIMSKYPQKWLVHCKDYAEVIFVHFEIEEDLGEIFNEISSYSVEPGLVIMMSTAPTAVKKYINEIRNLMLLTIPKPGKSGQDFDISALVRIDDINLWSERKHFSLYVDGGVSEENIHLLNVEGAVSGSSVLKHDKPVKQIMRLQTSGHYEQLQDLQNKET